MTDNMVLLGIAVVSRFGALPITIGFVTPLIAIVAFIAGAAAPLPLFPAGLHARRSDALRNICVIVAYIGGASLGALLFLAFQRKVLLFPTLAFAGIAFWLDRKAFI